MPKTEVILTQPIVGLGAESDQVKVAAEGCAQLCGSAAYLEPLLVDRRGHCRLMRPDAK